MVPHDDNIRAIFLASSHKLFLRREDSVFKKIEDPCCPCCTKPTQKKSAGLSMTICVRKFTQDYTFMKGDQTRTLLVVQALSLFVKGDRSYASAQ